MVDRVAASRLSHQRGGELDPIGFLLGHPGFRPPVGQGNTSRNASPDMCAFALHQPKRIAIPYRTVMHLRRLYIENYRSIKVLDLHFGKGKNIIIGRNNTGKSNIVRALDLVLGENVPTYAKSDNIGPNDFYTLKNKDGDPEPAQDLFIWCELRRDDGEILNYDELYKCYGFYICTEGRYGPPCRITAGTLPKNHDQLFTLTEDNAPGKEYVNSKLRHQQTFEQQFENKHHFAFAFAATRDEDNRITRDIRFLYRENETTDWILAFRAPIRNELLQSAIIPSFRDPQLQLRLAHWTWYGKLMRHLTAQHTRSADLTAALGQVQQVANDIFSTIKATIAQSTLDVAFPGTDLSFQLSADAGIDLYKSCFIYVDDGFKSPLVDKGSGIQSATIIGLFTYYTQHVNTVTAALLSIEEPELYLHPHARRVISKRLDEFIGTKNQVILTTHSAEFLSATSADLTLTIIKKDKTGTSATTIDLSVYRDLLLNAAHNELFFADKVIITEGYDEYVLRAVANAHFPNTLDEQNISIIPVGGKDNIRRLAQLVLHLGTPCFLLADFDYLLRDKSDDRKKYGDIKARESILNLGATFFRQQATYGAVGSQVYVQLQRLRAALKAENDRAFYTGKRATEFSNLDLLKTLSSLQQHGICILRGEIEDLFWDTEIASVTKKFTLESATILQQRLDAGAPLDDILDATNLDDFLRYVVSV